MRLYDAVCSYIEARAEAWRAMGLEAEFHVLDTQECEDYEE